jgi:hypothetical protein
MPFQRLPSYPECHPVRWPAMEASRTISRLIEPGADALASSGTKNASSWRKHSRLLGLRSDLPALVDTNARTMESQVGCS